MIMNAGDKAGLVRIGELHLFEVHFPLAGRGALGGLENKSRPVVDRHLLGFTGHRILDRFERDLKFVAQTYGTLQAIEAKIERHETRFQECTKGRSQDLEWKAARLAGSDRKERVALFRRRFFVHEKEDGTIAFVNRARPFGGEAETRAVE